MRIAKGRATDECRVKREVHPDRCKRRDELPGPEASGSVNYPVAYCTRISKLSKCVSGAFSGSPPWMFRGEMEKN